MAAFGENAEVEEEFDEISDEEKEMISLMEYESKESQIWVWIVATIIAVLLYRYFER